MSYSNYYTEQKEQKKTQGKRERKTKAEQKNSLITWLSSIFDTISLWFLGSNTILQHKSDMFHSVFGTLGFFCVSSELFTSCYESIANWFSDFCFGNSSIVQICTISCFCVIVQTSGEPCN